MSLPCLRLVEILSEWRPCFVLIFHHLAVDLLEVLVALGIQPRLRFTILLWLVLREKKGLGEAQKSSLIFRVPRADMWRCTASSEPGLQGARECAQCTDPPNSTPFRRPRGASKKGSQPFSTVNCAARKANRSCECASTAIGHRFSLIPLDAHRISRESFEVILAMSPGSPISM